MSDGGNVSHPDTYVKRPDKNIFGALAAAALLVFALCGDALAQQVPVPQQRQAYGCQPRATIIKQLAEKYSERPSALALQANGVLLEVYRTAGGETWTVLLTRPDGTSCIAAVGRDWVDVPAPQDAGQRAGYTPGDLR